MRQATVYNMSLTKPNERPPLVRSIIERLDSIEKQRRATLHARYLRDYPEIGETEIDRLCELVVSTRIRLIAEAALARLPEDSVDQVLGRFER